VNRVSGRRRKKSLTSVERLLGHTARSISTREIAVHTIWSIKAPPSRNVEHNPINRQQNPAPVQAVERLERFWGVCFEEEGWGVRFGEPCVRVFEFGWEVGGGEEVGGKRIVELLI